MRLKKFLENKINNKEITWDNKSQLIKASGEKVNGNNIKILKIYEKKFKFGSVQKIKDKEILKYFSKQPKNSFISVEGAKKINADRVELFTGPYAKQYLNDKNNAINKYIKCAEAANKIGIGLNAGHDLNQENLEFFKNNIVNLKEVSIGHALISESIYSGLQSTIKSYLKILN